MEGTWNQSKNYMKITLKKIHDLYPNGKIICVEEYRSTNYWTSILPDGTDVRDSDLYYKYGLNFVVTLCIQNNVEMISFKVLNEDKEYCFPDYKPSELIEN